MRIPHTDRLIIGAKAEPVLIGARADPKRNGA
jgi:hypothetical protein